MSAWLIAFVTLIYAWVAYTYLPLRPGMCIAFLGYCLANIGLIVDALQFSGACK